MGKLEISEYQYITISKRIVNVGILYWKYDKNVMGI